MADSRFSKRTKEFAFVVLLPIPYLILATLFCAAWHTQLRRDATSGNWFEWCMPDGVLFNVLLSLILLASAIFVVPLLVSGIRD
jgi:uncharacterized membrane protein YhdT